jgi:hypothetical protein
MRVRRIDTMNGVPCHAVQCFSKTAAGATSAL